MLAALTEAGRIEAERLREATLALVGAVMARIPAASHDPVRESLRLIRQAVQSGADDPCSCCPPPPDAEA